MTCVACCLPPPTHLLCDDSQPGDYHFRFLVSDVSGMAHPSMAVSDAYACEEILGPTGAKVLCNKVRLRRWCVTGCDCVAAASPVRQRNRSASPLPTRAACHKVSVGVPAAFYLFYATGWRHCNVMYKMLRDGKVLMPQAGAPR